MSVSSSTRFKSDGRLCILRSGHMGDVLIIEPVVASLRRSYAHVTLFTDYPDAAELTGAFDIVRPYLEHLQIQAGEFDRVLRLVYEIYPGVNHLDGYARCAEVALGHRVPRVRPPPPPLIDEPYGLIAPSTSDWVRQMRQWPRERFDSLSKILEERLGYPFHMLEATYSFNEMVSLVAHCRIFVGNDSGPAILAQCYGRRCFVIFGATSPERILLSGTALGISHDVGCNGCKHFTRHMDEVECASPLCLDLLSVEEVAEQVISSLASISAAPAAQT